MLRRTPSLALRAALIFTAVYAAIFLAVAGVSAAANWADRGDGNLSGPVLAVDYAADELREVNGRLQLPRDGRFADLAARNPALWLIVIRDGRVFTAGAVRPSAVRSVTQLESAIGSVMFRVPGERMPLAAGARERRDLAFGSVVLAAGGVSPATLSAREAAQLLFEPELAVVLAVIALISLAATFVAVPLFARALEPITADAVGIGPDDPARRLDESKAPRELRPLIRAFNAALDRLESELGRRRRFIADAAHELRTPLAVISLQVESLAEESGKLNLRRGVSRLTNIVAQMLHLERLSLAGQRHLPLDLVGVTRDVIADLAPLAIAQGRDLSLDAPATPVKVTGDAQAIARALTNLIGNALAHGGGAINVAVGTDRNIDVADDGPGVPVDLRPRLFEPFARGDPSGDGCGLGLHLTREIMHAHGGTVRLLPTVGGTTFALAFPPPVEWRPRTACC